jgi:hypothetical protein
MDATRQRLRRHHPLPRREFLVHGRQRAGQAAGFLPYCAGVDFYRASCDEVVARDYLGFKLTGPNGSQCNDGVVRRLQPDVEMLLGQMAE